MFNSYEQCNRPAPPGRAKPNYVYVCALCVCVFLCVCVWLFVRSCSQEQSRTSPTSLRRVTSNYVCTSWICCGVSCCSVLLRAVARSRSDERGRTSPTPLMRARPNYICVYCVVSCCLPSLAHTNVKPDWSVPMECILFLFSKLNIISDS